MMWSNKICKKWRGIFRVLPLAGITLSLLVGVGELYGENCPPGDVADCKRAVTNGGAQNGLVPFAGGLLGWIAAGFVSGLPNVQPPKEDKPRDPIIQDDDTKQRDDCQKLGEELYGLKEEYNRRKAIAKTVQAALDDADKLKGVNDLIVKTHARCDKGEFELNTFIARRSILYGGVTAIWEAAWLGLNKVMLNFCEDPSVPIGLGGAGLGFAGALQTGWQVANKIQAMEAVARGVAGVAQAEAAATPLTISGSSIVGGYLGEAAIVGYIGERQDTWIKKMQSQLYETRAEVKALEIQRNAVSDKLQQIKMVHGSQPIGSTEMYALGAEIHAKGKNYYNRCWNYGAPFESDASSSYGDSVPDNWLMYVVGSN